MSIVVYHLLYTSNGRGAIAYYSIMGFQSLLQGNIVIVPAPSYLRAGGNLIKNIEVMSGITCSYGCRMKFDLQNAEDKLLLLKDNWPSFFDVGSIAALSKDELKCSMCLLDVVLNAMAKKRFFYSKRKVRDLTNLRSFMSTIVRLSDAVDKDADASRQGTYHNWVDNKI